MRKLLYILMLVGLICSCERNELDIKQKGDGISSGEATISFSALMPSSPVSTKSMGGRGNPVEGVNNLYLVVFDENGMLVETRMANLVGEPSKHGDNHDSEQQYSVTLTLTEKPRIIHFIANCPVDQIVYGHEASVIGNMYVENGQVAYWARIEVDELIIDTDQAGNPVKDLQNNPLLTEVDKFKCVPMLRNYAQLTITNDETDFEFEGYCIYNVTHRGTIAPYNSYSEPVGFQNFVKANGTKYNYPELYALPYYGHALTSTQLITTIPTEFNTNTCNVDVYRWKDEDGIALSSPRVETVKGYGPTYLYERKISVKQGDEAAWRESPSHLIIKGKFGNDEKSTYYKVDLTRKIDGVPQYYNILRNFHYNFTIHEVHSSGYSSIDAAIAGSTSNNLSGSASTSKFDNISDQEGRLWVSYTAKTLVEGGDGVTLDFYYKYASRLDDEGTENVDETVISNNTYISDEVPYVLFENHLGGNVIDASSENEGINFDISEEDEPVNSPWAGYRKVTMNIKTPKELIEEQIFTIKAINVSNGAAEVLSRNIHLILKTPYQLKVNCTTPKVAANINEEVVVEILIPDDLTENLFPLDLNIEAEKRSLSPNLERNTLPVVSGKSIIPGKTNNSSFYYVKTIETYEEYKDINNFERRVINGKKYVVIPTYWITNRTDNESYVYVQNEYFVTDSTNFVNAKAFESLTLNGGNTVREGAGRTVSATLVLPASDNSYASRNIKFTLEGLSLDGSTEPFYITPTSRTITINNLVTTDANSTLTIKAEEESYAEISASVGRRRGTFSNLTFSQNNNTVTSVPLSSAQNVTFSFEMSDYENGMPVTVVLEGFETTKAEYTHTVSGTGKQTISLTAPADVSICSVKLMADGFDEAVATLDRRNVSTYTVTRSISGTLSGDVEYNKNRTNFSVTITSREQNTTASGNITRSWSNNKYTYSYSFSIQDWEIEYTDPGQIVNIRLRYQDNSNNYYSGTCTVQNLIKGNISNLVLTKE